VVINAKIVAGPTAFLPLICIPPNLNDDLFGFLRLSVPNLLEIDTLKPDLARFRFISLFFVDHLPLSMEVPFCTPIVNPLNVFDALNPCLVL